MSGLCGTSSKAGRRGNTVIYQDEKVTFKNANSKIEQRLYLQQRFIRLGNELPELYGGSLQNHCYWRICSDAACRAPWKTRVREPFYKYAPVEILRRAVCYLEYLAVHEDLIKDLNIYSLKLRGRVRSTR
jgi:hypothetical protein